ncbi:glycerophosphodiester phosphodiesterase 1 isoform X2 [Polistes fuscatus]|uniref:glycerophosphodiester phosphodiesterase 1 isoform X2 n=1 Tax=Polistes fuscatus TaxID=30207 RepID=UPI001CAA2A9A|nr:glycerophosphodiester phosphodiesterase 1 isoform X2 [Polistes fuscatus]
MNHRICIIIFLKMHGTVELILNSALLWILLEATWTVLVSILYSFRIPWIFWGSLIILVGLKLVRVPPPRASIVNEVLAHRGGGYDYPENSLSAFQNSKDKGCTAVELDLTLTKDNIPIVFHDANIERLTGQKGVVSEMTWDQLKELDITYNHPLRNKFSEGEKIALFKDALQTCLKNDLRVIIDIKETRLDVIQVILDAYKENPNLFKKAIVSSFNPVIVYLIRRKEPRIVSSLAWRPHYFSRESYLGINGSGPSRFVNPFKHLAACIMDALYEWALPSFIYYIVGISIILLHKDIINLRVIEKWHNRGIRVMAWTVNLPSEKLHFYRLLKITYLTDTLLTEKV